MAFPNLALNDVLQLTIRGFLHGQRTINTFYYKVTTVSISDPTSGYDDLFAQFETVMWSVLRLRLSNELNSVKFRAQKIFPAPRIIFDEYTPTNDTGGAALTSMPTSVAVVVRRRNSTSGRSHQGRIFVPGLPTTHETDSRIAAAQQAAWAVFSVLMLGSLTGADGWVFQPVHRRRLASTPFWAFETIDFTSTDDVLRVQRKREIGVGE